MMYGWWEYGTWHPWYGMIFGPIIMLVLIALCIAFMFFVMRGWQLRERSDSALELLKERFARGEIDRSEYEERKQLLMRS